MDENMENQTPDPDNQGQPEQPQQSPPPEYGETAPPIPEQPAPQTDTPLPEASGTLSKDERMWGMICHLAAFAGYIGVPFGNILGPLIIWLIKKDDYAFVDDQGKESLNFQISICICGLVISPTVCFLPLFILLATALGIANIVFIVIASIKANEGQAYRYPYSLRLVK